MVIQGEKYYFIYANDSVEVSIIYIPLNSIAISNHDVLGMNINPHNNSYQECLDDMDNLGLILKNNNNEFLLNNTGEILTK